MPEYPDYCNDDFPVLSFCYALYCDNDFSTKANTKWRQSLGLPVSGYAQAPGGNPPKLTAEVLSSQKAYDGYLDDYRNNRKVEFPKKAINFIKVTVALNPPKGILYAPTKEQGAAFAKDYLVPELMGTAPVSHNAAATQRAGKREPAKENGERPLIACLARIFLNEDSTFKANPAKFLKDANIGTKENAALLAFGNAKRKHLTEQEADDLVQGLANEFSEPPFPW
jgi:hypothetical protein